MKNLFMYFRYVLYAVKHNSHLCIKFSSSRTHKNVSLTLKLQTHKPTQYYNTFQKSKLI